MRLFLLLNPFLVIFNFIKSLHWIESSLHLILCVKTVIPSNFRLRLLFADWTTSVSVGEGKPITELVVCKTKPCWVAWCPFMFSEVFASNRVEFTSNLLKMQAKVVLTLYHQSTLESHSIHFLPTTQIESRHTNASTSPRLHIRSEPTATAGRS